jgi:hypothetical protein
LWEIVEPLLPEFEPRRRAGNGSAESAGGIHPRGVGPDYRLHEAVLDELGAQGELDWSAATVDAASVRTKWGVS